MQLLDTSIFVMQALVLTLEQISVVTCSSLFGLLSVSQCYRYRCVKDTANQILFWVIYQPAQVVMTATDSYIYWDSLKFKTELGCLFKFVHFGNANGNRTKKVSFDGENTQNVWGLSTFSRNNINLH